MELGALMPFFRVHCTLFALSQDPWSFGPRALELSRRVLRRRYRLLPLLYRLALEAHTEGLPIVRPLFMHFDVPAGKGAGEFLLGDSLLAAPILHRGATRREAWLPPGPWVDWNTGERHAGGQDIDVEAPLGTTPLFVRGGAVLFLAEPARNAEATLRGPLALEVTAPPPGAVGHGSLFLDDGESAAGARFILDVVVENDPRGLLVRLTRTADGFLPAQHDFELRAPAGYSCVSADGEPHELVRQVLGPEDRSAVVMATRVPLAARELLLT
jgi:alpha-glucosidase